jgi:hypothetical protein
VREQRGLVSNLRALGRPWVVGGLLFVTAGTLFLIKERSFFLPGKTSSGHHLIEGSCNSCHGGFEQVRNDSCSECHRAELASDTHPVSVFQDPRWAADLRETDATRCVTCHGEHREARGGVTIASSFCYPCHDDVPEKRATHKGLPPTSCGEAGCHNYHDNGTLTTAYLAKHDGEPALLRRDGLPSLGSPPIAAAAAPRPDADPALGAPAALVEAWLAGRHAAAGVSCSGCHGTGASLVRKPGVEKCGECHGFEQASWHLGKHGARDKLALDPLTAADARLPMKAASGAAARVMSCGTCHDVHRVDLRQAAVEACLACHDDAHSRSFASSSHGRTFGTGPGTPGPAEVSCATCHLPRVEVEEKGARRVAVQHNNNFTLRPTDRMARLVCQRCHGLELSLRALLDRGQVERNFDGSPSRELETFRMIQAFQKANGGGKT